MDIDEELQVEDESSVVMDSYTSKYAEVGGVVYAGGNDDSASEEIVQEIDTAILIEDEQSASTSGEIVEDAGVVIVIDDEQSTSTEDASVRKFKRGEKDKYSMEEKMELVKVVQKHKKKYEASKNKRGGYLAPAVREFYPDLKKVKHDDPLLEKAIKMATRAMKRAASEDFDMESDPQKKKYRAEGGGRKTTHASVRIKMYEWFIDVRGTLKARLPRTLFKSQCEVFYEEWLSQQKEPVPEEERPVFSNHWIRNWMLEYGVSLLKPNKRYQIPHSDRVERIEEFLLNIWRVRKYFLDVFNVEIPILNGDQMPLHRNESHTNKTMSAKNQDVFVKENYSLSRERVTAFTQLSTEEGVSFKPEFVFKGKGVKIHLNPPAGVYAQWADKGSYRLKNMEVSINHLPKRNNNPFTHKDYAIYVLDNYSVHIQPEVKSYLLKRGYIYVGIGGGITGDIQINDTDLHAPLKKEYREREMKLMIEKLRKDPKKIPQPERDEMMEMLTDAMESVDINVNERMKVLWITNKLDGSEDHLVSERIFTLVGESLLKKRAELMKKASPKSLQELLRSITPPKGVKRKALASEEAPEDEGSELLDCDGDLLDIAAIDLEDIELDVVVEEEGATQDNTEGGNEVDVQSESQQAEVVIEDIHAEVTNNLLRAASGHTEIEKDAKFLVAFHKFFKEHGGSTTPDFKHCLANFKSAYKAGKRSVINRLKNST